MATDPFRLLGTTIGDKYRVDQVIGEGGFGVVYRGFHEAFEHAIAVKCLKVPGHFTNDARRLFLDRFKEEGKLLSKLSQHPSIVRVFDFGQLPGVRDVPVPYLVLEWLEGAELGAVLTARQAEGKPPFSEQEALAWLTPVVDAIALAHRLGVAHRDLKPPNLFIAKTVQGWTTKVLDFGIAKAMQEGETVTQQVTHTKSGFSAFSAQYGAPEQFHSKKYGPTGPWTDVYALGLILVEMVTGRAALEGDEQAALYEATTSPDRPTPRTLGMQVSPQFEALCAKALARSSSDRFKDAGEMLRVITALKKQTTELESAKESSAPNRVATSLAKAVQTFSPEQQQRPVPTPIIDGEIEKDTAGADESPGLRPKTALNKAVQTFIPKPVSVPQNEAESGASAASPAANREPSFSEHKPVLTRSTRPVVLGLSIAVAAVVLAAVAAVAVNRRDTQSSPLRIDSAPGASASTPSAGASPDAAATEQPGPAVEIPPESSVPSTGAAAAPTAKVVDTKTASVHVSNSPQADTKAPEPGAPNAAQTSTDDPFDKSAAASAIAARKGAAAGCKRENGPTGHAKVSVTFAPSGRVTTVSVNGPPFAGTSVAQCVVSKFQGMTIPPFSGSPVTVHTSVAIL